MESYILSRPGWTVEMSVKDFLIEVGMPTLIVCSTILLAGSWLCTATVHACFFSLLLTVDVIICLEFLL